jgi:hypothetical protein
LGDREADRRVHRETTEISIGSQGDQEITEAFLPITGRPRTLPSVHREIRRSRRHSFQSQGDQEIAERPQGHHREIRRSQRDDRDITGRSGDQEIVPGIHFSSHQLSVISSHEDR